MKRSRNPASAASDTPTEITIRICSVRFMQSFLSEGFQNNPFVNSLRGRLCLP